MPPLSLQRGKRQGRYWLVGDVHNTPGRSLFVRLQESPKGPAGKWTDAATGEHGDLLDVRWPSLDRQVLVRPIVAARVETQTATMMDVSYSAIQQIGFDHGPLDRAGYCKEPTGSLLRFGRCCRTDGP